MTDIKSMLPEEIEAALRELGEPKYRAKQIFQWLSRGVRSFEEMTNLSKSLREKLAYADVPKPLEGIGIAFLLAGMLSLAFLGFSGMM